MERKDEAQAPYEEAAAVGVLLAEAFIARVRRFPDELRRHLLIACHQHLLEGDQETASILFKGE